MQPIHITFIITDLLIGGAEMMLFKLLSSINRQRFSPSVISLTGSGPMLEKLEQINIPVRCLNMNPGKPDPRLIFKLARWLKTDTPDLVQTWMYHADLIGGLAVQMAGKPPLIWSVRNHTLNPAVIKTSTLWVVRILAILSKWLPEKIIFNAETTGQLHVNFGYRADKTLVIPNGFDTQAFQPDPEAHLAICKELELPPQTQLIGLIARFDPMKDHHNFIKAAEIAIRNTPDIHYVLVGENITPDNTELTNWISQAGLENHIHLLGPRTDIPHILAALDIATTSSSGEAFSNVIGEAMSVGTPCVVTDVGDSAYIVDDTGRIVPPHQPDALAQAWQEILALPAEQRQHLGQKARSRIKTLFDIDTVTTHFENLYMQIIKNNPTLKDNHD